MRTKLGILFLILLIPLVIIFLKPTHTCTLKKNLCELEYPAAKVYKQENWVAGGQEFYYTFLATESFDNVKKYYDSIVPTKNWQLWSILRDKNDTKTYNLVNSDKEHVFLILDKKQDNSTKITIEFHFE